MAATTGWRGFAHFLQLLQENGDEERGRPRLAWASVRSGVRAVSGV
ncbi:hypothetical protein [Actinomadura chibensis]|nr:hypothetical protein [Actinomadura chibensis]